MGRYEASVGRDRLQDDIQGDKPCGGGKGRCCCFSIVVTIVEQRRAVSNLRTLGIHFKSTSGVGREGGGRFTWARMGITKFTSSAVVAANRDSDGKGGGNITW